MDMTALALAFGIAWSPVAVTVPKGVPVGPAAARPVGAVFDASGAARSWAEAVTTLASARIVAVGESHDDAGHLFISGHGVDERAFLERVVHERADAAERRTED